MTPLETHVQFFGAVAPATEMQALFYTNDLARGFSSTEREPEKTDASIIRALSYAYDRNREPRYALTYLFFPANQRPWVSERILAIAKVFHGRIGPILGTERGMLAINHVRQWLESLNLGPVEAWKGAGPPEHWAVFGYTKEDNVPDWLKGRLI